MTYVEALTEESRRLRSLARALRKAAEDGCSRECLEPSAARRLCVVEHALIAELKAHDELEDRCLTEALLSAARDEVSPLIRTVRSDRDALRELLRILSAVMEPASGEYAYSVRFAVARLSLELERRLGFVDETELPLLRRLSPPALSAAERP